MIRAHNDYSRYRVTVFAIVGKSRHGNATIKPAVLEVIRMAYKAGKTPEQAAAMVIRIFDILSKAKP